jgi:hypothetical protein
MAAGAAGGGVSKNGERSRVGQKSEEEEGLDFLDVYSSNTVHNGHTVHNGNAYTAQKKSANE